jgi:hypothetical protein
MESSSGVKLVYYDSSEYPCTEAVADVKRFLSWFYGVEVVEFKLSARQVMKLVSGLKYRSFTQDFKTWLIVLEIAGSR